MNASLSSEFNHEAKSFTNTFLKNGEVARGKIEMVEFEWVARGIGSELSALVDGGGAYPSSSSRIHGGTEGTRAQQAWN